MYRIIQQSKEAKIFLVLGVRGSGKSYLTKQNLKRLNRVMVYDTLNEYTDGVIFQNIDDLLNFITEHQEKSFRVIYQPLEPTAEFEYFCEIAYSCQNVTVVIEEIDRFCDSTHLGKGFANIVQRGRHHNITLIATCQRPFRVNRTLSSQVKELYVFQMTEPRDIDFLSEFVRQDIQEKIKNLKQYQYIHWSSPNIIKINK